MKIDIGDIDIISFLEDRDIEYNTSGKNVSSGWIGISCIFCDDHSTHLGISSKNIFNCFKCSEKGNVVKLIKEIDGCSWNEAYKTANNFIEKFKQIKEQKKSTNTDMVDFPKLSTNKFKKPYIDYLKKRGFNPEFIIKKYDLHIGGPVGDFRNRIIIPYYENGELVTYSSRTIIKDTALKYKHLGNEKSIIPVKEVVYNLDNCNNDSVIVVEGCTDVWKLGDDCCSLSGIQWTPTQANKIIEKGFKNIFIIFDSEENAQNLATKLSQYLSYMVSHVEIIEIDAPDPASLTNKESNYIKKQLKI